MTLCCSILLPLISVTVLWIAISLFGWYKLNSIFKKYRARAKVVITDQYRLESWKAVYRTDFGKWKYQQMLINCFVVLPIKIVLLAFGLVTLTVLLIIEPYLKIVISKCLKIFVKAYCRPVLQYLVRYSQYIDEHIDTPIIVSNHVNWFDLFFMEIVFWRVSFVSKAEIAKTPLIGSIGKSMQNIYVERDVEKSRKQTLEEITKRVESYESGQVLPLVLFPEGTTSNGRGMLKFKLGAFINKAPITVICLKYICNYFSMGMDEIKQSDHLWLTLCSSPRLEVQRFQMYARADESAEEYCNRTIAEMEKKLGFKAYNIGYGEKGKYQEFINKKVSEIII